MNGIDWKHRWVRIAAGLVVVVIAIAAISEAFIRPVLHTEEIPGQPQSNLPPKQSSAEGESKHTTSSPSATQSSVQDKPQTTFAARVVDTLRENKASAIAITVLSLLVVAGAVAMAVVFSQRQQASFFQQADDSGLQAEVDELKREVQARDQVIAGLQTQTEHAAGGTIAAIVLGAALGIGILAFGVYYWKKTTDGSGGGHYQLMDQDDAKL